MKKVTYYFAIKNEKNLFFSEYNDLIHLWVISSFIKSIDYQEDLYRLLNILNNLVDSEYKKCIFATELYNLDFLYHKNSKYLYFFDTLAKKWQKYDYCYITPRDLKKILEIYIEEYEKFKANPEEYKKLVEKSWWAIERGVELEDEVESWVKVFEG